MSVFCNQYRSQHIVIDIKIIHDVPSDQSDVIGKVFLSCTCKVPRLYVKHLYDNLLVAASLLWHS